MNDPGWFWYGTAATVGVPYLAAALWILWEGRRK